MRGLFCVFACLAWIYPLASAQAGECRASSWSRSDWTQFRAALVKQESYDKWIKPEVWPPIQSYRYAATLLKQCAPRLEELGMTSCMHNARIFVSERAETEKLYSNPSALAELANLSPAEANRAPRDMGLLMSDAENYSQTADLTLPRELEAALPLPPHAELRFILDSLFMRGAPSDSAIAQVQPARLQGLVRMIRDQQIPFLVYHSQAFGNPSNRGGGDSYGRFILRVRGESGARDRFIQLTTSIDGQPQQLIDVIGVRRGSNGSTLAFRQYWRGADGGAPVQPRINVHSQGVESCTACHAGGLRPIYPLETNERVAFGAPAAHLRGTIKPADSPETQAWFRKQLDAMNAELGSYGTFDREGSLVPNPAKRFPYLGDYGVSVRPRFGRSFQSAEALVDYCLANAPAPANAVFTPITDPAKRGKLVDVGNCSSCHRVGGMRPPIADHMPTFGVHHKIVRDQSMPPGLKGDPSVTENDRRALETCLYELKSAQIGSWIESESCPTDTTASVPPPSAGAPAPALEAR